MHYLYRYVCILNVFFICVYGQLSAIKNLLLLIPVNPPDFARIFVLIAHICYHVQVVSKREVGSP